MALHRFIYWIRCNEIGTISVKSNKIVIVPNRNGQSMNCNSWRAAGTWYLRWCLCLSLSSMGKFVLKEQSWMVSAIIGSFISAMATVLGALPLLFVKTVWKVEGYTGCVYRRHHGECNDIWINSAGARGVKAMDSDSWSNRWNTRAWPYREKCASYWYWAL